MKGITIDEFSIQISDGKKITRFFLWHSSTPACQIVIAGKDGVMVVDGVVKWTRPEQAAAARKNIELARAANPDFVCTECHARVVKVQPVFYGGQLYCQACWRKGWPITRL